MSWLFSFLPQWFWTLTILLGIIGFLISWFLKLHPLVVLYRIPVQILSVALITSGIYFHGVLDNEKKWKARVEELEQKLREKEKQSDEVNKKLEQEIADKKQMQEEKNKQILEYLNRLKKENRTEILVPGPERVRTEKIIEYIEKCPVPKEFIDIHNQAAKGANK